MGEQMPETVRVTRVLEEHECVTLYKGVEEERKVYVPRYVYYVGLAVQGFAFRPLAKRRIPAWAAEAIQTAFPDVVIPAHRIRP